MEHPNSNYRSHDPREKKPKDRNRWWMWGAAAAVLFPKLKGLLSVLKLGKVGGTVISMFVTVGAYALLFPWQFAIGLVVMILIHELGHVWAAKKRGLPVSAPTFIPFLGALITMKRHPRDAETEAYLAFGGPVIGTAGALGAFWLGTILDSPLLHTIAMVGLFLNLINLLPIHPLDGGRIVTAVSRWFWLLGLVGGLAVIFYLQSILFFIIWAMFAWDLYGKYGRKKNRRLHAFPVTAEIPVEAFQQSGLFIPGEEHRRRLPFTSYCDIKSGEHRVEIHWPGISENIHTATIPFPSTIKHVELHGLKREPDHYAPTHLVAQIQVALEPFENDRYYEVPVRTRWTYGVAYIGLAAFLIYMYFFVLPPYLPEM